MAPASLEDAERAGEREAAKRMRAKHACRVCNSRRVKCNVTECQPCSNCEAAGTTCEVLPSRRGRYPRKSSRKAQAAAAVLSSPVSAGTTAGDNEATRLAMAMPASASSQQQSPPQQQQQQHNQQQHLHQQQQQQQTNHSATNARLPARSPSPSTDSAAPGTLFFGESNFLTLVPGHRHGSDSSDSRNPGDERQKARLLFPITQVPQSIMAATGASPASIERLSAGTSRYLQDEGALTLPSMQACIPALQAYFTWFHPCFPILDRADFERRVAAADVSIILMQAVLFIGATYCDAGTVTSMGFRDRSEAKSLLYTRARLLFHADWEKDEVTLIQSLFLMSFWRGGPSDVRDVRYWLGVVIGVAESYGLHRSAKFTTRDPHRARMRRRMWWSIYVRERQAAASLGLPSRIRDEDCDIEPLSALDLESDVQIQESGIFGSCEPEHITYAIKMVEISRILGQIIDVHFAPGRPPSTPEQTRALDQSLEDWRRSIPEEIGRRVEDGTASVWGHLLLLAYNHLRILIYRHNFLRHGDEDGDGKIAAAAASKISRIAEDMLAQGTLRYGQMHLITSLFAALCIHAISIKRGSDVGRRIAEHRAQMCLMGLQEIQKYWRINNNVLDLFLQYLDVSIAKRLHGAAAQAEANGLHGLPGLEPAEETVREAAAHEDVPPLQAMDQMKAFEDQYFSLLYGPWEGDRGASEVGAVLQQDGGTMQMEGLNFLGRSL